MNPLGYSACVEPLPAHRRYDDCSGRPRFIETPSEVGERYSDHALASETSPRRAASLSHFVISPLHPAAGDPVTTERHALTDDTPVLHAPRAPIAYEPGQDSWKSRDKVYWAETGHSDSHMRSNRMSYLRRYNKSFTDVTFIVGPPASSKKYVGHRVLLAMTSPVFEAMFYGDMADKSKVIRIPDIAPIGFENLLRYAYTDSLNLQTVEDAMLTAYAAKKYLLPHLLRECFNFIEKNVTPKTVCSVYEFAVVMEAPGLLFQCLNVIDRQTYHVLTSPTFPSVNVSTLEMIVKRNHLNIYSEYSLYNALYVWAQEECKRRNLEGDVEQLRSVLDSTLPHIRFLTMSAEEFCKGPAKMGILNKEECYCIFMNLAIPGIIPMPKGLSTETTRRSAPPEYFICKRYKAASYHTPSRPLRLFGIRFTVTNQDIFLVGAGFPVRLDTGYYSIRQPKFDGILRLTSKIQEDKTEREEEEVTFTLSKDKDVKVRLRKPFFVRKNIECELELHMSSLMAEDVIAPSLRNRKKEETVEGVTFQFSPFHRGHLTHVMEVMEFSELYFYY